MSQPTEKGEWKTIKGVHVFIRDGESATEALNRTIAKNNEDKKAAQIAKQKKEADALNGKPAEKHDQAYYDKVYDYIKDMKGFDALVKYIGGSATLSPEAILRTNGLESHLTEFAKRTYGDDSKESISIIRKVVIDKANSYRDKLLKEKK